MGGRFFRNDSLSPPGVGQIISPSRLPILHSRLGDTRRHARSAFSLNDPSLHLLERTKIFHEQNGSRFHGWLVATSTAFGSFWVSKRFRSARFFFRLTSILRQLNGRFWDAMFANFILFLRATSYTSTPCCCSMSTAPQDLTGQQKAGRRVAHFPGHGKPAAFAATHFRKT